MAWTPAMLRDRTDAIVLETRADAVATGARAVPSDLRAFAAEVPHGRPVVVICEDGVRSSGVAERLAALGVRAGWLAGGAA
jgi:rhodanese-related sulfurtransferase